MKEKNKKVEILSVLLLIVLIVGLGATVYLRRNVITNIVRIEKDKFDEVKCVNEECDFVKASDYSKNTTYIYDSDGNKISKYTISNKKTLYDAASTYLLFKNINKKGEVIEYYVSKATGKKVYSSKNELSVLSDYLIEEKDGDNYNIINYKGDVLYSNISKVKRYKSVSSIKVLDEEYLINEKGERTLADYVIDREVLDDDGETLYLILQDSSKAYYYFDTKNEKFKGDSFTSYDFNEEKKTIKAYKESNGETTVLDISKKGEQKESEEESQVKIVKKIKPLVDEEKYRLYQKGLYSNLQDKVLVDNLEENSFGIYDLKEKTYKELYKYTSEKGSSIIISFKSYDDDKFYQINCSEDMCGETKILVYDAKNGKVLFSTIYGENKIKNFTGYKGEYKVVKYTSDSTEEFRDKYVLYNKKNEVITSSSNLITVIDKDLLYGKKYDEEPSIIYSAKEKKVFNNDDSLADTKKVNKVKVYTYEDDNNIYVISNKGKELLKVDKSKANLIFNKDLLINVSNKKVTLISANNGKVGEYKFKDNETVLVNSENTVPSYKKSIFVNNTSDKYGKLVYYSGKKNKVIKKTNICEVYQSKKTKNIIIITTDSNNKYGFYIAK